MSFRGVIGVIFLNCYVISTTTPCVLFRSVCYTHISKLSPSFTLTYWPNSPSMATQLPAPPPRWYWNGQLLCYVSTVYGERAEADVKADIDLYLVVRMKCVLALVIIIFSISCFANYGTVCGESLAWCFLSFRYNSGNGIGSVITGYVGVKLNVIHPCPPPRLPTRT